MNQPRFGRQTEKLDDIAGQFSFFNEAEANYNGTAPEPAREEVIESAKKGSRKSKKKGQREEDLKDFPQKKISHDIPEQELNEAFGSSATTAFAFSRDAFLLSWAWIALSIFCHNFDLGFWHNRENIAVEMHREALVFGVREHLTHSLQHPHALVTDDEIYAVQAASTKPLEEAASAGDR